MNCSCYECEVCYAHHKHIHKLYETLYAWITVNMAALRKLNTHKRHCFPRREVESSWNVTAHGDARQGKWKGYWRMEWVASTLHTTSEHGVSSITTADAHTSAASSQLNWRPPSDLNGLVRFAERDEIWFLRVCHHISNAVHQRRWYEK